MLKWAIILNKVTQIMLIAEDGKIDDMEEDILVEMVAPELAKLYKKETGVPVEKWGIVKVLVKIAQRTIEIINARDSKENGSMSEY